MTPNNTTATPLFEGIDLDSLRLSQNFGETVGVKKALITVPVRKPSRQSFFRVRAGEEWQLQTAILELKEERESFLVAPALWPELMDEIKPVLLVTAIDRQGVLFLWPLALPAPDGRFHEWGRSAMEAAKRSEDHWVSLRSNTGLGAYEVFDAAGSLPDPEWPEHSLQQLINIAFRDRYIQDLDHDVLRRLRGEA